MFFDKCEKEGHWHVPRSLMHIDARFIHFPDSLGKIRRIQGIDVRPLAGEIIDSIGNFGSRMVRVPIDICCHGGSPFTGYAQVRNTAGLRGSQGRIGNRRARHSHWPMAEAASDRLRSVRE